MRTVSVSDLAAIACCLLFLSGCDTMDDGTDYSSTDSGSTYSAPSTDDSSYEPSVSSDSGSDAYSSSQAKSDRDAADQMREDAEAQQERDYQQTQSDLNEADQYHASNDD